MRSEFGRWGLDLDDDRFAMALAAAGVINPGEWRKGAEEWAERLAARFGPPPSATYAGTSIWRFPSELLSGLPRAWEFAYAWERFRNQYPSAPARIFLMVSPHQNGLVFARYLTRPSVGSVAFHFADGWMSADADWRWPLRVGYAPGAGTAAVPRLSDREWVRTLHVGYEISSTAEFCDLLIVADPLSKFLFRLTRNEVRVDANCVLFLGESDLSWGRSVPQLEAVATHTHASGVGFVDIRPDEFGPWFTELIRFLSHDEPIDLALASAATTLRIAHPLLWAHPSLAQAASTRQRAQVLADMTRDYRVDAAAPTGIREEAGGRMAESDIAELEEVATRLERVPDSIEFDRESGWATDVATDAPRAERLIAETALTRETISRRILAGVFALIDDEPRLLPGGFVVDLPMLVRVAIGSFIEGWAAAEERFPFETLPASAEPHELTIVLSAPGLLPDPLVATIVLPRTGPSTTCTFPLGVLPPSPLEQVRARVSVLFRNRILQTAILSGPVLRDLGQAQDGPTQISVEVEAAIRPGFADLGERRRFDGALLFNHTEEGESGVQTVAGRRIDLTLNPNLDAVVAQFQRLISDVAKAPQMYEVIEAPETRALLVGLARHGTLLRDALFLGPWLEIMRKANRIQLVSVDPWVFVPVELVYDRPSPDDGAQLCPNWTARATKDPNTSEGRCGDDCPAGAQVICPLAFWCTSKVIERCAVDVTGPPPDLLRDIRFESEPTTVRRKLPLFQSALLGASGRVDQFMADGTKRVFDALGQATAGHARNVTTWRDWTKSITSLEPALLLLLPHTERDNQNIETLEIGKDAVAVDRIGVGYVHDETKDAAPIVILLGCSTALPTLPFQSFVVKFRSNGASVVIGTTATILGRHASPAAEELIRAIRTSADKADGATLGEVVRDARRTLLSKGVVMALALTAYGDADWRLVPAGRA